MDRSLYNKTTLSSRISHLKFEVLHICQSVMDFRGLIELLKPALSTLLAMLVLEFISAHIPKTNGKAIGWKAFFVDRPTRLRRSA
jgi:hypothetical protein